MMTACSGGGNVSYKYHVTPDESDINYKVPFWIGNERRILSGIKKSTTCSDVTRALLPPSADPSKYVIVEKWRKMERKLDPNSKVLKIWRAWGDQQDDVAFKLIKYHSTSDGYIDKKSSSSSSPNKLSSRRKSSHHHSRLPLEDEKKGEAVQIADSVEKLLKLVLTQGETIQVQLRKLRHQEEQIEKYEEKMDRLRSAENGANYVVDSYLRDDAKNKAKLRLDSTKHNLTESENSRLETDLVGKGLEDFEKIKKSRLGSELLGKSRLKSEKLKKRTKESESRSNLDKSNVESYIFESEGGGVRNEEEESELIEKIYELNSKLTLEEERLVRLGIKIRQIVEKESCRTSSNCEKDERKLISEMYNELECLREVTRVQSCEIDGNEEALNRLESLLDSKHDFLTSLTYEIQAADAESEILQERLRNPPSSYGLRLEEEKVVDYEINGSSVGSSSKEKQQSDNDSNSDTGISSLHSSGSGEENCSMFLLDTLV